MILPFTPRRLTSVLLCVIGTLVAGYIGTRYLALVHGHDYLLGFLRQFDMDSENNIPPWYSSTALFFVAWLLMLTAHAKQQNREIYTRHWWGLAAIFLYLSLNESSSLHEMTIEPVRNALHTSGYFHYAWVLPAACLLVVFGLAYLRFLQHLPTRIRSLFLLAGTVYVGGAIGVEMLGRMEVSTAGNHTVGYTVLVGIEEGMEMLGVVIFIHAVSVHLAAVYGSEEYDKSGIRFSDGLPNRAHVPPEGLVARRPANSAIQARFTKTAGKQRMGR
jgi:hypothetical protein